MQPGFAKWRTAVAGDNGEAVEDEVNGAGDEQGAEVELAAKNGCDEHGSGRGEMEEEGFAGHGKSGSLSQLVAT